MSAPPSRTENLSENIITNATSALLSTSTTTFPPPRMPAYQTKITKPVNTFAGSYLNRLSWLRSSHSFLNAIVNSPKSRWVLFKAGNPLVTSNANGVKQLAYLPTLDVKSFLGPSPFFGQAKNPEELISTAEENSHTEAVRHLGPPVVFLGLKEPESDDVAALPSSEFKDADAAIANLEGTPYFSIDLSVLELEDGKIEESLKNTETAKSSDLTWVEPRTLLSTMDAFDASVFAVARSMTDWNIRNKYCAACGSKCYSMWGGWKIACSSLLPWADNTGRKPCVTGKGLHNFTHPRTDPVVIMVAVDEAQDKILLGRSRKFPGKFYSALAGFIEPAETFEDAVQREMWEEAGVKVWDIMYHSGQPWPYPANLMIGFFARGDADKPVRLDLDNELVDAQWFTRSEVLAVLDHPLGTTLSPRDNKRLDDIIKGKKNLSSATGVDEEAPFDEPPFRIPPLTAIAGVLIRDWADGKIKLPTGDKASL